MSIGDLAEVVGLFAVVWMAGFAVGVSMGLLRRLRDVV